MAKRARLTARGFTLIELLLVVLVLGLIAAIAVPRLAHSGEEARQSVCQSNISRMNSAIELWAVCSGGDYPGSVGEAPLTERSLLPIGTYPTTQSECKTEIFENREIFPDGLPQCPYGDPYEYDAKTNRIKPHHH